MAKVKRQKAKAQLKADIKQFEENKEYKEQPPRGGTLGISMAETFKRMETAHKKDGEWGNYKEYSAHIRNMQCLMKTVLENFSQESLGNQNGPSPNNNMGVTNDHDGETMWEWTTSRFKDRSLSLFSPP